MSNNIRVNIKETCPVRSVIVYNDRAEVTRVLQHHFERAGMFDLVLEGFSPCVDQTSFHVNGGIGNSCKILEVSYQTHRETPSTSTVDKNLVEKLQQELDQLQIEINEHEQEIERAKKQRTWLDGRATKLMDEGKTLLEFNVESMNEFLTFYHQTLAQIDKGINKEQIILKDLNIQRDALNTKLAEHGTALTTPKQIERQEVTITVEIVEDNVDISLEVAYLISQCSWSPSYDVRVSIMENQAPKTQLTYYGILVNRSQEDWTDAQFALSSTKPSLGGIPPQLSTSTVRTRAYSPGIFSSLVGSPYGGSISYGSGPTKRPSTRPKSRITYGCGAYRSSSTDEEVEDEPTVGNVSDKQKTMTFFSANFVIPRRATIDADGKPHKLIIDVLDLTSNFTYTIVPKLSLHAYLKASTLNDSDKYLLAGPTSIFMNNNFITHTSISNVCIDDTFDVPLGIDPNIKVEYKPVKKNEYTQGLISRCHYKTIRHETHVTNKKNNQVTIFVYDQYPVTTDDRVKVNLVIPDLQRKEIQPNRKITLKENNNLEWKCILRPRSECQLPFEYTIEWPTNLRMDLE